MNDDHKEENPDLYEFYTHELTEEEGRDFLEKIGVDTPETQREILDSMRAPSSGEFNAQSSKTDLDEIPNRIPLGRKVPYSTKGIGSGKSRTAAEILKRAFELHREREASQGINDNPEGDQNPPEQEPPINACGDVLGENGLPLINEKAYEAYKRCL